MIGKKPLAAIKSRLRDALDAERVDLAWFEQQVRKLTEQPKPNAMEIETLIMIRDALNRAAQSATRRPVRKRPARTRATE